MPSNGLIGCFSAEESQVLATAWEPYQELFQGVITCLHSDFRIGGLKPGETDALREQLAMIAVNVRAPFFVVQQLLPILHSGASVILVSSLAARAVVGTLSAYASTKGAVDTLVKHFASVLGPHGIRVNAVAPGIVQTDMSSFTKTDVGRDYALGIQALKRLAEPEDIAGVVAFLASDDARWITGDTIHVDGGSKL